MFANDVDWHQHELVAGLRYCLTGNSPRVTSIHTGPDTDGTILQSATSQVRLDKRRDEIGNNELKDNRQLENSRRMRKPL